MSKRKARKLTRLQQLEVDVRNNKQFQNFIMSALEYHNLVYKKGSDWKIKSQEDKK